MVEIHGQRFDAANKFRYFFQKDKPVGPSSFAFVRTGFCFSAGFGILTGAPLLTRLGVLHGLQLADGRTRPKIEQTSDSATLGTPFGFLLGDPYQKPTGGCFVAVV